MFEGKYSKLLTILLIVGIILIIGGLGFFGFSVIRNNNIKKDAEDAVEQFQGKVKSNNKKNEENVEPGELIAPELDIENIITNNGNTNSDKINTYKGFPMYGTIEIPAISLKYPIISLSNKAMDVAVCLMGGSGLNQIGNTTIAGHNYRDGRFFSDNKKLKNGDKIYITDTSGKKVEYIIYNIYITEQNDSEYMNRDTNGKREISLTTCTDDSKSRLIIWAKES